ncbi:MAG: hypothetical protein GKR89_17675 [Candidatus Latescibacteria bacterium]|nr:hypothetical protein [Candidatus Latescibacterota bacterium]
MGRSYDWSFPLARTHAGPLQGNALLGVMIWGGGRTLRLTLGRAGLWDHRGGMPWTQAQSYANIRACLEAGDEERLRQLFEETEPGSQEPRRPSILPLGRFDIDLGAGARLQRARLDIDTGEVTVHWRRRGRAQQGRLVLDMKKSLLRLETSRGSGFEGVACVPAWEYVGDELAQVGFDPPELFNTDKATGWTQMRPADEPVCAAYAQAGGTLCLSVECGATPAKARARVAGLLGRGLADKKLVERNRGWWRAYWRDVPKVQVPNQRLRFLYEYGLYKFAGLTCPDGVAATLQGAWVEEYQMPPWSNDYHFNINVQMCYWPAFHGNRLEHLRPLFDLVDQWRPVLRHNARVFLGIDDGLMLPHAVDDQGTCMGGFWTGSVDHGCTAWVAQMMYRYYRYTMDRDFLVQTAYPFMVGAMRVYEEMLEQQDGHWVLPVSVSPEYRGAALDAWGRNASFQLACIHQLCADLLAASKALKKRPRPIWRQLSDELPRACLQGSQGQEQIALWEGTLLEESHRHHSHLAGLVPFDVIDLDDAAWQGVVERSLAHWIRLGPGLWSGWCVPWASMIHTRVGNADAAELWLEIWQRVFTNEGHGTLHDVHFSGFSLMGKGASASPSTRLEIMQAEAGMSCVAAIQEMLLHVRSGVNYLFRGAPQSWRQVGFEAMRTDGAFLVGARRRNGRVGPVQVHSLAGGLFRLANPWDGDVRVYRGKKEQLLTGPVLEVAMKAGERVEIRAGR